MGQSPNVGQRGGAQFKFIFTLVILGAMIFSAVKVVPVYFANYQFQDALNSESRFALTGYPKRSAEDIRDDVFKKAQDLGIPAKREAIQVNLANGSVDISLDYAVPIDLGVYQWTRNFIPTRTTTPSKIEMA